MLRSFYSGISGLTNHQQAMDVLGNNLANVNTIGYKGNRTTFTDTLSQTVQGASQGTSVQGGTNPMQVGLGMTVASIDKDMGQGALQTTGRALDLAIQGDGWFVVGEQNEFFYSRAGNFSVDDAHNLVNASGDRVYGWVDSDQDGVVDPSRDLQGWINLDRRGDGQITNALASATPPINGPNTGDAAIDVISVTPSTISDTWRVECVNSQLGLFKVVGEHSGVLTLNHSYTNLFNHPDLGSFTINQTTPQQALVSVPISNPDGFGETLELVNTGLTDSVISFSTQTTSASPVVSGTGPYDVGLAVDADGNVVSTYGEVINALGAAGAIDAAATLAASAITDLNDQAVPLNGQFVLAAASATTTLDLGDTSPQGVFMARAVDYGAGGNAISIEFANNGFNQNLGVSVLGSKITVTLETDALGNIVSTLNDVASEINAHPTASTMVTAEVPDPDGDNDPTTGDPALLATAFSETFLSGGAGADVGDFFTFTTTAPGGALLESISVNARGGIIGVFENGSTEEIARVALGRVPNPEGMLAVGEGKFVESPSSGTGFPPLTPGTDGVGSIASGFLEMSNVDLTSEFTNMIINQRGFQANSRIITTSDEMLQELMAIKR